MNNITAESSFEPKILAFLCNWCSYAGADLAGVSRIQYPPNVRVIRLMCSGRVDPVFVVDALIKKVDGVLILGCHLGDCHYSDGNYEAKIKYEMLDNLLSYVKMNNRVAIDWVSAAEGTYFGEIITKFTNKIKNLGANPLSLNKEENREENQLFFDIQAIKRVVLDSRVRKLVGRERKITLQGNAYENKFDQVKFKEILDETLKNEFLRNKIYIKLKKNPTSVDEIADLFHIDSQIIFKEFLVLRQRGLLDVDKIDGLIPIYKIIN